MALKNETVLCGGWKQQRRVDDSLLVGYLVLETTSARLHWNSIDLEGLTSQYLLEACCRYPAICRPHEPRQQDRPAAAVDDHKVGKTVHSVDITLLRRNPISSIENQKMNSENHFAKSNEEKEI